MGPKSSGLPSLPEGKNSPPLGRLAAIESVAPVGTNPGTMVLAVIPYRARLKDSTRLSWIMPPLLQQYM